MAMQDQINRSRAHVEWRRGALEQHLRWAAEAELSGNPALAQYFLDCALTDEQWNREDEALNRRMEELMKSDPSLRSPPRLYLVK